MKKYRIFDFDGREINNLVVEAMYVFCSTEEAFKQFECECKQRLISIEHHLTGTGWYVWSDEFAVWCKIPDNICEEIAVTTYNPCTM